MSTEVTVASELMPPKAPWLPLEPAEPEEGYASIYYSDPLARYPVRHITKLGDNKSDPNIETMTYGLFSTCEERMRQGIVRDHRPWIFFITNLAGRGRALTGLYRIGFYALAPAGPRDVALAASQSRFIDPIPLTEIPGELGERLRIRFRTYMGLDAAHCAELRTLVESREDHTAAYLSEVARLERYSLATSGYTYPTWKRERSFGVDEAAAYLTPHQRDDEPIVANSSPTGQWRCRDCDDVSASVSRLKLCPNCQRIGTLVAVQLTEI